MSNYQTGYVEPVRSTHLLNLGLLPSTSNRVHVKDVVKVPHRRLPSRNDISRNDGRDGYRNYMATANISTSPFVVRDSRCAAVSIVGNSSLFKDSVVSWLGVSPKRKLPLPDIEVVASLDDSQNIRVRPATDLIPQNGKAKQLAATADVTFRKEANLNMFEDSESDEHIWNMKRQKLSNDTVSVRFNDCTLPKPYEIVNKTATAAACHFEFVVNGNDEVEHSGSSPVGKQAESHTVNATNLLSVTMNSGQLAIKSPSATVAGCYLLPPKNAEVSSAPKVELLPRKPGHSLKSQLPLYRNIVATNEMSRISDSQATSCVSEQEYRLRRLQNAMDLMKKLSSQPTSTSAMKKIDSVPLFSGGVLAMPYVSSAAVTSSPLSLASVAVAQQPVSFAVASSPTTISTSSLLLVAETSSEFRKRSPTVTLSTAVTSNSGFSLSRADTVVLNPAQSEAPSLSSLAVPAATAVPLVPSFSFGAAGTSTSSTHSASLPSLITTTTATTTIPMFSFGSTPSTGSAPFSFPKGSLAANVVVSTTTSSTSGFSFPSIVSLPSASSLTTKTSVSTVSTMSFGGSVSSPLKSSNSAPNLQHMATGSFATTVMPNLTSGFNFGSANSSTQQTGFAFSRPASSNTPGSPMATDLSTLRSPFVTPTALSFGSSATPTPSLKTSASTPSFVLATPQNPLQFGTPNLGSTPVFSASNPFSVDAGSAMARKTVAATRRRRR